MEVRDKKIFTKWSIYCFCLFIAFLSLSCGQRNKMVKNEKNFIIGVEDSIMHQFEKFRKSIINNNNKDDSKAFFIFPLLNSDVWYKVLNDKEIEIANLQKPFAEKDYDRYFTKLFTHDFKKCILKINMTELFKYGTYKTESFSYSENGYTITSHVEAIYKDDKLTLEMISTIESKLDEINSDHTEIYEFKIINGKLIFNTILMAG